MRSFDARSREAEWMDGDAVTAADFAACLRDLAAVNTVTRARPPTLGWLAAATAGWPRGSAFTLLDVGYGEGDMLRAIARWAAAQGFRARLIGVDMNPLSEPAARAATDRMARRRGASLNGGLNGSLTGRLTDIDFRTGDVFAFDPGERLDFVVSSLVTHHMDDAAVTAFLTWMDARAARGWFVNDLRRSGFAFYGFRALATVLRWHRFVRHDGPVSIARSFVAADWDRLLAAAGITGARVTPAFPFRLTVGRVKP